MWENWTRADLGLFGKNEENWIKSMKFVHENFYITHVMIIFIQHKLKKNVSLARFVYSIYRNISGLYDNQSHKYFIEIKTQEGICHPYQKNCCMLAQKYVYSLQSHVTITYSKGK